MAKLTPIQRTAMEWFTAGCTYIECDPRGYKPYKIQTIRSLIKKDYIEITGIRDWELFNLREDPSESNNLSKNNMAKLQELVSEWEKYKDDVGVIYDPFDISVIGDH